MTRKLAGFIFALVWLVGSAVAVNAADRLDDKLVQYVRNAKKAGDKQAQVEQKAIKAGWPAATVREAITFVYGSSKANTPVQTVAENRTTALPPASPAPAPETMSPATEKHPAVTPAETTPPRASGPAAPSSGYEYRIGAGDVLAISVWNEPQASAASVLVRPDGMISTSLTKEIHVAGMTPSEAENLITEKLVKVIQEPNVTVVVTGMASKKIYAVGAVKREGPIPYTYSMTVMQAIAEAGGLTDYAKRKRIYVMRTQNGKETRFAFPYDDVLNGKHMEMNIPLLPGDTLVVPH
jgi:polysaccharide export outer membrane protein